MKHPAAHLALPLAIAATAEATLTGVLTEAADGDINGTPVRITHVYALASSSTDRVGQVQAYPLGGSATYHHRDIFTDGEYSTTVGTFSPSLSLGGGTLDSYVTVGNTINASNGTQPNSGWGPNGLNRPDFPVPTGIQGYCSWVNFNTNAAGPNALGRILVAQFVTNRDDIAAWSFSISSLNGGLVVTDTVLVAPDLCPDSAKNTPGECGCDHADIDSDGDGASDCNDAPTTTVALPMPLADTKVNPGGFGGTIAASGDWIAVGAVQSTYLSDLARGAVILYHRSAGQWKQVQSLVAPLEFPYSPNASDGFGAAIAIHGDMLFVGAPSRRVTATGTQTRGTVYAYRYDARTQKWLLRQAIVSPRAIGNTSSSFGQRIAFDSVAMRLFATDPADRVQPTNAGIVSILELDGDSLWTERAYVANPTVEASNNTFFGAAIACFGNELAIGAPNNYPGNPGFVFIFRRDARGAWNLAQALSRPNTDGAPVGFGWSIGMNARTLAVATSFMEMPAPWGLALPAKKYTGAVLHERGKNGLWQRVGDLVATDLLVRLTGAYDASPRLDLDGDRLSFTTRLGLQNYVYRRIGGSAWAQYTKTKYGPLAWINGPGASMLFGPLLLSAHGPKVEWEDGTLVAQDLGLADCDGDGVADLDTDGDGLPDCIDPDDDGDGIDE